MTKTKYLIGLASFSIIGIIVGLLGVKYFNEYRENKATFKDIVELVAPSSYMLVTPTGNLDKDIALFEDALRSKRMPKPGRVVEQIGFTKNLDHIYILKYWVGDKDSGNIQEFKAIALSKDSIVVGNELHFIAYDTILISKDTPYKFCNVKSLKGKNVSNEWESVALCIDSNKNAIVEYLSGLKRAKEQETQRIRATENDARVREIYAKAAAEEKIIREQTAQQILINENKRKQQETDAAIKNKETELKIQQDIVRAQEIRAKEFQKEQDRLYALSTDTKALMLATIKEINLALAPYDMYNIPRTFEDDNLNIQFLIDVIQKNTTQLPAEYLKDVYAMKEYKEYEGKTKEFNDALVVTRKKLNSWNIYVAKINSPEEKRRIQNEKENSRRQALARQAESKARAEQSRRDAAYRLSREPRMVVVLGASTPIR